jgi:arylsulfatase A-like enzyme
VPPELLALVLAGAFAASCGARTASGTAQRPNILIVVFDTLRADRLPFHGHAVDTAPFLDDLARRSVVFERAWSPSSWTPPAMASIFTGVLPFQHGVYSSLTSALKEEGTTVPVNRIPGDLETIPEFLHSLGYRTFGLSDNPNICEVMGFASGFDRFRDFDAEGAQRMTAALEEWRAEIRGASPWFVYLHYMDPHAPYHRHEPWFQTPPAGASEAQTKLLAYDSEIAYADMHLKRAFELLGVDDDTLVVFTADHGEEFLDHGRWSHLFQLYSELTHVPLLIRQPGMTPLRARVQANVSLVDLFPTLRAILGAPPSAQDEGRDLTPYYLAEEPPAERAIIGQRRATQAELEFVVEGDHKLILQRPTMRRELYDLAADRGEHHDLAAQRPELVQQLEAHLKAFRASAPRWKRELTEVALNAEDRSKLQELGYGGGDDEGGTEH